MAYQLALGAHAWGTPDSLVRPDDHPFPSQSSIALVSRVGMTHTELAALLPATDGTAAGGVGPSLEIASSSARCRRSRLTYPSVRQRSPLTEPQLHLASDRATAYASTPDGPVRVARLHHGVE